MSWKSAVQNPNFWEFQRRSGSDLNDFFFFFHGPVHSPSMSLGHRTKQKLQIGLKNPHPRCPHEYTAAQSPQFAKSSAAWGHVLGSSMSALPFAPSTYTWFIYNANVRSGNPINRPISLAKYLTWELITIQPNICFRWSKIPEACNMMNVKNIKVLTFTSWPIHWEAYCPLRILISQNQQGKVKPILSKFINCPTKRLFKRTKVC